MLVAVLAAAGSYSVAQAQGTGETGDQTALAVPRVGLRGAAGVGLPQPLSPSEAAQVRRIFSLQGGGSVAEAARETERLQNDLLLGRHPGGPLPARPSRAAAELAAWLTRFGDQPEAPAIRGLLERAGAGARQRPPAADPPAATPRQCGALRPRPDRCSCRTVTPRRSPPPAARPADARGAACRRPGRTAARPGRCRRVCSRLPTATHRHLRCGRREHSGPPGWRSAAAIAAGSPSGCVAPRWRAIRSMA